MGFSVPPRLGGELCGLVTSAAIGAAEAAPAPTATAAAPETASSATRAAWAAFLARPGFIDRQRPIFVLEAVEGRDRLVGLGIVFHFHKPETARAAGFAVGDDLGTGDLAVFSEKFEQVVGGRGPGEVADVDVLSHSQKNLSAHAHDTPTPFRAPGRNNV